jgi:hypothetical protein
MKMVYNIFDVIIVNYNYYAIDFQCYPILNVQFDLLGRRLLKNQTNSFDFDFREDGHQKEDNTYNDIRFEETCILYNIGALYSKLGANETRRTHEVDWKKNISEKIENILII